MSKNSYAEDIKNAEVMSAGLTTNAAQTAKRGLDKVFITKMQTDLKKAISLNNEQEKLKADLKRKTAELEAQMSVLNASVKQARKLVKIDFPQAQWVEFGITTKK
jgi:hypothetical protein